MSATLIEIRPMPYEFGCEHCAGTGYQDYPSKKKPCPIPGHKEKADANEAFVAAGMIALADWNRKNLPMPAQCPYCKATEKCEHWTGLGWWNPRFYASFEDMRTGKMRVDAPAL